MDRLNVPIGARTHEIYLRRLNLTSSQFDVVNEVIGCINEEVERVNARQQDLGIVTYVHVRRLSNTVKDFIRDAYILEQWLEVSWKGRTATLTRQVNNI